MDVKIEELIEELSKPAAYSHETGRIEVRQTHISVVFLAGDYAYKIKKPVNMGFLDFSSLDKREFFCNQELRLNQRLAPTIYEAVVPITLDPAGLKMDGQGEVVEWAVKMKRLSDELTLLKRLEQETLDADQVKELARRLALFHINAEHNEQISAFGSYGVVAGNAWDNLVQAQALLGITISRAVWERLTVLMADALAKLGPFIRDRAQQGVPRDTHGDLHLDHIYLFPEKPNPENMAILDCIEFNERFRYADPIADMAFVVMDLLFHNRQDLAQLFADAYFEASQDFEGKALLKFYASYRAAVRGKVEGIQFGEQEVPEAHRLQARTRSRAHWLLTLGLLEDNPSKKPGLILVGGLPGAGKSTLARDLAKACDFAVIRSDVVRKELAGLSEQTQASADFEQGLYSKAWSEKTYAECLERAKSLLFEGKRVIIDASFHQEEKRQWFLNAPEFQGVPRLFLICQANSEIVQARIHSRVNDASDANWSIHARVAKLWEPLRPTTQRVAQEIRTDGSPESSLTQALNALRQVGLTN